MERLDKKDKIFIATIAVVLIVGAVLLYFYIRSLPPCSLNSNEDDIRTTCCKAERNLSFEGLRADVYFSRCTPDSKDIVVDVSQTKGYDYDVGVIGTVSRVILEATDRNPAWRYQYDDYYLYIDDGSYEGTFKAQINKVYKCREMFNQDEEKGAKCLLNVWKKVDKSYIDCKEEVSFKCSR